MRTNLKLTGFAELEKKLEALPAKIAKRATNKAMRGAAKLVAYMTPDQRGAITLFEEAGFRAEALLRDHVRDRDGRKHDLVVLSHDVERVRARHAAFGLNDAF